MRASKLYLSRPALIVIKGLLPQLIRSVTVLLEPGWDSSNIPRGLVLATALRLVHVWPGILYLELVCTILLMLVYWLPSFERWLWVEWHHTTNQRSPAVVVYLTRALKVVTLL